MNTLTYSYTVVLLALGLIGFFATGRQSVTALIPAFFAVAVIVAFWITSAWAGTSVQKWTMIALAVVGVAATVSGIPMVIKLIGGGEIARPPAAISQSIMALVSLGYAIATFTVAR